MKPEEKAKELIQKFRILVGSHVNDEGTTINNYLVGKKAAISSAIICVEELIKEHTWASPISWNVKQKAYWEQVKAFIK